MNFLNNYFLTLLHIFHFAQTFSFTELLSLLAELLLSVVVASFSLYLMVFVSSQNVHEMCKLLQSAKSCRPSLRGKMWPNKYAVIPRSEFPISRFTIAPDAISIQWKWWVLHWLLIAIVEGVEATRTCVCLVNSIRARLKRILFVAGEKEEIDKQIKFSSFANFYRYPKPS